MKQVIHEVAPTQHRLVIVTEGIPQASPWYEYRQVGKFRNIYFHVGAAGDLPAVFTPREVTHEVL
jgi:hypothetical protein